MNAKPESDGNLVYGKEAYAIVGAAMEVYNQLGSGFLEAVYQEALALEMRDRAIPFREQVEIPIIYKGRQLQHVYRADYLAYEKIIVEIKAIKTNTPVEEAQLLHYLRATQLRLGLLINFGHPDRLQWSRRVF